MNDRTSDLTSLASFLAGGVTGVAIAWFLAPESGEEARKRRGRRPRNAAGSSRDATDRVIEEPAFAT
jgi:gas vesicle protein